MWTIKNFKTEEKMNNWIAKNSAKYQYVRIFVNNGYALEVRKLRVIG